MPQPVDWLRDNQLSTGWGIVVRVRYATGTITDTPWDWRSTPVPRPILHHHMSLLSQSNPLQVLLLFMHLNHIILHNFMLFYNNVYLLAVVFLLDFVCMACPWPVVCSDLCCCTRLDAISISSRPTGAKRWPTDAVPEVTFGTGVASGREVSPQSAEYRND